MSRSCINKNKWAILMRIKWRGRVYGARIGGINIACFNFRMTLPCFQILTKCFMFLVVFGLCSWNPYLISLYPYPGRVSLRERLLVKKIYQQPEGARILPWISWDSWLHRGTLAVMFAWDWNPTLHTNGPQEWRETECWWWCAAKVANLPTVK